MSQHLLSMSRKMIRLTKLSLQPLAPRCLTIKLEHKDEKKDENRGSSESHQACLNGRVASEEGKANKKEHYLRREFSYSNYEQALTLPDDVEKDKIVAKVDNGVLHITLPRTAKAEKETKKIEVA